MRSEGSSGRATELPSGQYTSTLVATSLPSQTVFLHYTVEEMLKLAWIVLHKVSFLTLEHNEMLFLFKSGIEKFTLQGSVAIIKVAWLMKTEL